MSVWVASQTISVMTTTGKSALRRKRFTNSLIGRVPAVYYLNDRPSGPLRHCVWIQYGHVGQIPVSLAEVQAVADHELVGNLEAGVTDVDVDLAPLGLREQGADLERRGVARFEVAGQVREREARVDDVFDDQHIAAFDADVEVLEDPDDTGGVGGRAVARDRHEVDLAGNRQVTHEV